MERFYLHGDLIQDTERLYYCACCDLLQEAGHFQEHDTPDPNYPRAKHSKNVTRYRRDVEKWVKWDWHGVVERSGWYRPLDPPNLFAGEARGKWRSLRKI